MEVARIKGRKIYWGGGDMMVAGGPDKRTDRRAVEKTRGVLTRMEVAVDDRQTHTRARGRK